VLVGEFAVGILLSLVVAFFLVKDGRLVRDATVRAFKPDNRRSAARAIERAWDALGGYLRGAAALGALEGVVVGIALFAVGADIVVPVMVLTFVAAFVPIVGATAAGVVAVLVALVTAGTVQAVIVGAVVLIVQQFDNDLLAPIVYGRALRLHPLVILLGIGVGGALFGLVGTVFAVPALAAGLNAASGYREQPSTAALAAARGH
jgi:predicted PurR-regulated permease PerM